MRHAALLSAPASPPTTPRVMSAAVESVPAAAPSAVLTTKPAADAPVRTTNMPVPSVRLSAPDTRSCDSLAAMTANRPVARSSMSDAARPSLRFASSVPSPFAIASAFSRISRAVRRTRRGTGTSKFVLRALPLPLLLLAVLACFAGTPAAREDDAAANAPGESAVVVVPAPGGAPGDACPRDCPPSRPPDESITRSCIPGTIFSSDDTSGLRSSMLVSVRASAGLSPCRAHSDHTVSPCFTSTSFTIGERE
mmetsp:Transcript_20974/g.67866  ORF Transcript_20974/g.67866 Transcript_20974/m.67866 type:complete len:252 (-) Transcript_20974:86-841(-)